MSERPGEKTEEPTPRKLEQAARRGEFARSAEVQTVFVLTAAMLAFKLAGPELWLRLVSAQSSIFGHLHEIPLSVDMMQGYAVSAALVFGGCVLPVLVATMAGGLLAGGIQSRFQIASEALDTKWERINPAQGLKRIFSGKSLVLAAISLLKLVVIVGLSFSQIKKIAADPIFFTAVNPVRIAEFMAQSAFSITWRIGLALMLIAAVDYTYQRWRTRRDLMMTRQELKDELKNTEGDPHMKARRRRQRTAKTMGQMLREVPTADVVVTNPTHLAIALRYDRRRMKAPKIIAKGARLNALKIREIAARHHVPIIENKPLARLIFKHGRVGGEIPAQLFAAVAEVLAWVYRVNRYRYYTEQNQMG
jgi:flagellar biosynthesis protein FlhB